ncbi:MAG: hypothetical protein V7694_09460 [Rhodococcus sp. (in: high G+C Gram-positive bacteria)]
MTAFAAACARRALPTYETASLRQLAWAAHKAAREVQASAATHAALSAMHASGAAFLHPLYSPHQVKHILGSAVHLVLADPEAAAEQFEWIDSQADTTLRSVLRRYPCPVVGGARFGVLMVRLDTELRR